MDRNKLQIVKQIENVFWNLSQNKLPENKAEILLSKLANKLTNSVMPVKIIYDADYVDIFTRIELDHESSTDPAQLDGTCIARPMEIVINRRLATIYDPKELTAAFLYELGLYENLLNAKDCGLQALAEFGFSLPAHAFVLATGLNTVFSYASSKLFANNGKVRVRFSASVLVVSIVVSFLYTVLLGLIYYLVTLTKYKYTSRKSYKYVVKFGYADALKSFLEKHTRVSYPYGMKWFRRIGSVINKTIKYLTKVLIFSTKNKGNIEQLVQLCDLKAELVEQATQLENKGIVISSVLNDIEYLKKVCKGYLGEKEIERLERVYMTKVKLASTDVKKFLR